MDLVACMEEVIKCTKKIKKFKIPVCLKTFILLLFRFGNEGEDENLIGMYGTPDDKEKMVHTHNIKLIPYSGNLLREKTFLNLWKNGFSWKKTSIICSLVPPTVN